MKHKVISPARKFKLSNIISVLIITVLFLLITTWVWLNFLYIPDRDRYATWTFGSKLIPIDNSSVAYQCNRLAVNLREGVSSKEILYLARKTNARIIQSPGRNSPYYVFKLRGFCSLEKMDKAVDILLNILDEDGQPYVIDVRKSVILYERIRF